MTKRPHQLHIKRIDIQVIEKSLFVVVIDGRHEVLSQIDTQDLKALGYRTGAAPMHAEN